MNTQFQAKLLQNLAKNKKNNEGFTLIELLVVVIIIGVLAAIALPSLLGQVGKAREVEAKNLVGRINNAQQEYYTTKAQFAPIAAGTSDAQSLAALDELEVSKPKTNFFAFPNLTTAAVVLIQGLDNPKNGTKDYVGGVAWNTVDKSFSTALGRANSAQKSTNYVLATSDVTTPGVLTPAGNTVGLGTKVEEIK